MGIEDAGILSSIALGEAAPEDLARAKVATEDVYAAAGRTIEPQGALDKPTFNKHGDPGASSNRNTVGYGVFAYRLRGDKQALLQAALVAERLFETWDTKDRAHSHRYAWLGPLALALKEIGDQRWKYILDRFNDVLSWFHGQKYLNGSLVGATMRPLRCLFEGGLTGAFGVRLAKAGLAADNTGGAQLIQKANDSIEQFLTRTIGGDIHWGWTRTPGAWKPGWKRFPYVDSLDPKTMATHSTAFHALHVMPYSYLMGEIAGLAVSKLDVYTIRRREISSHALRLCYDPRSGRNVKSIGYKADHDVRKREAYYAEGFATKPCRRQDDAWKDELTEQGYHDVSPAVGAVLTAGEITKSEARKVLVKWVKDARGIVSGEIPIGVVSLALRVM